MGQLVPSPTSQATGSTTDDIPADLQHAILDQALRLYDLRGDIEAPAHLHRRSHA